MGKKFWEGGTAPPQTPLHVGRGIHTPHASGHSTTSPTNDFWIRHSFLRVAYSTNYGNHRFENGV